MNIICELYRSEDDENVLLADMLLKNIILENTDYIINKHEVTEPFFFNSIEAEIPILYINKNNYYITLASIAYELKGDFTNIKEYLDNLPNEYENNLKCLFSTKQFKLLELHEKVTTIFQEYDLNIRLYKQWESHHYIQIGGRSIRSVVNLKSKPHPILSACCFVLINKENNKKIDDYIKLLELEDLDKIKEGILKIIN